MIAVIDSSIPPATMMRIQRRLTDNGWMDSFFLTHEGNHNSYSCSWLIQIDLKDKYSVKIFQNYSQFVTCNWTCLSFCFQLLWIFSEGLFETSALAAVFISAACRDLFASIPFGFLVCLFFSAPLFVFFPGFC